MSVIPTAFNLEIGDLIVTWVRAINAQGPGEYSAANSIGALVVGPPTSVPFNLRSWSTLTSITLEWDYNGTSSYEIFWNQGSVINTWVSLINTTLNQHTLSNLDTGTDYLFRIRAFNQLGNGTFTPDYYEWTAIAPGWMDPITSSMSSTNVWISWNLPNLTNGADVTSYRLLILEWSTYTFWEYPLLCNGSTSTSVATRWCDIPMLNITSTLSYQPGQLIIAKA